MLIHVNPLSLRHRTHELHFSLRSRSMLWPYHRVGCAKVSTPHADPKQRWSQRHLTQMLGLGSNMDQTYSKMTSSPWACWDGIEMEKIGSPQSIALNMTTRWLDGRFSDDPLGRLRKYDADLCISSAASDQSIAAIAGAQMWSHKSLRSFGHLVCS